MNINNIAKGLVAGLGFVASGGIIGVGIKALTDKISEKYVTQDEEAQVNGNVQLSSEEFNELQNELKSLKAQVEELQNSNEQTQTQESTSINGEDSQVSTTTNENEVIDQEESTNSLNDTQQTQSQTQIENKTTTQNSELKELDLATLTQSQAHDIWISYLNGQCEYDLNDDNIHEFCKKFGFDTSYIK